jgi:hypothetical protein
MYCFILYQRDPDCSDAALVGDKAAFGFSGSIATASGTLMWLCMSMTIIFFFSMACPSLIRRGRTSRTLGIRNHGKLNVDRWIIYLNFIDRSIRPSYTYASQKQAAERTKLSVFCPDPSCARAGAA